MPQSWIVTKFHWHRDMLAGPGEVSNRAGQDYVGRRGETESLLLLRSHPAVRCAMILRAFS